MPPIPTLLPEGFLQEAHAASAGMNSLVFFACPLCGACVVEHDRKDNNRRAHVNWHKRNNV